MRTRSKIIFTSLVLSLAGASALLCYLLYDTAGHFTIENQANTTIESCAVDVSNTHVNFDDIAQGEKRDFWFRANGDDHYHVALAFKSGDKRKTNIGYVTPNFGSRDMLIVFDHKMTFKPDKPMLFKIAEQIEFWKKSIGLSK
jgi:hypothetical protein